VMADSFASVILGHIKNNYAMMAQYDLDRYNRALNNFRAYNGCEPHPAMNMFAIIREYSVPWRKTKIPRVPAPPPKPQETP